MSARTIIVIGLALISGLSAVAAVNHLRNNKSAAATVPTTQVVVAAANLPRGMTLTKELLQLRDWPEGMLPAGAITSIEDAVDRAVLTPLAKDEPVMTAKIASRDAGRGMAAMVAPGMRAFTIQTPNVASGVGGFILPGNRVDVLLTVNDTKDDPTGGGSTSTLLQSVEVLAVDQQISAPAENKIDAKGLKSITLQVTPSQAAKLSLAQNKGTLQLSLRNDLDGGLAMTTPVTLRDLRFLQEGPSRASKLFDAIVKAVEASPTSTEVAQSTPVGTKPLPLRIRTLRGIQGGILYMQSNQEPDYQQPVLTR